MERTNGVEAMRFEIDMDAAFMRTFCNAGAPHADCDCGRTHISMLQYDCWDDQEPNEVENIRKSIEDEAEENDMIILEYENAYIDLMEIGSKVFVAGCECEGWKPYMNFMIDQRKEIAEFLIKTSKEIKRVQAYEGVMNVLEKEYE